MKKTILIFCLLLAVLPLGGCISKFTAYLDGKKNEKLALEYVSDTYGIDAEIISSWAGQMDLLNGRDADVFVMKESSKEGFPFRIEVFGGKITDEYPCYFIANEISKNVSQYLQEEYSEAIDSIKCHTEVYRTEVHAEGTALLTDMSEINRLPDRYIDISLYIVSSESVDVQQDMLCSVYQYLQETFDDFRLDFYFLDAEDFQIIEENFKENILFLSSFEMLDIHPLSSFEYYKGSDVEDLERSEILSLFEVYEE